MPAGRPRRSVAAATAAPTSASAGRTAAVELLARRAEAAPRGDGGELVKNAGYGQLGHFETIEPAAIARQFATNVFGLFDVTRAVLPVMRRQRAGHVFNLSSSGGALGFAGASVYCATKFAVEGFSESLALEVRPFGVRVTVVEPGYFRTDFLDGSSVAYGTREVEAYAAAAAEQRATYDAYSHQQPGDPAKLGRALVDLAASDDPPLRYVAGSDALGTVDEMLAARRAELERWRDLSVATDVDAPAGVA